ncbi:nucleotidyltransferase family protein [Gallaecimonas mangrovi]|uniref:nucleotidyltransferase family protein n=1 Tax=Gallaecimonas mangrovi TaxID=2291597 RepID=UPI000E20A25D|nr:nucleotidyltransferase family protein [Gallaecimonas mangrovi]
MNALLALLKNDPLRWRALQIVQAYGPANSYLAAGFVRNLVWDHLHQKNTALNDIDVVYFSPQAGGDAAFETRLKAKAPEFNWQVRNQAFMHQRNGDRPYTSVVDAMRFWPEKETAVAVRLDATGTLDCISAFGVERLFALTITPNPARDPAIVSARMAAKNWLEIWPKLTVQQGCDQPG